MRPTQLAAFFLLVTAATAVAQQPTTRRDIIKGRVTTDSGAAVADADVIVTMAPTREVVRGKSDSSGNYSLTLEKGTGEYLLYIGAVGRIAMRRRLTATGSDTTFAVDAKLAAVPVQALAAVKSVAARTRPTRSSSIEPGANGVFAGDRTPDGANGQISPDLAGNLEAMASVLPGYNMTPGGLSVGGVTGANLSTLNGLAMGAELPHDAKMSARFQSSPWDPTRGGFAGAQLGLSVGSGGDIAYRHARGMFDAPALQSGQPNAAIMGQKFRSGIGSFGADGPIVPGKYFYNYTIEGSRTQTPVASLLDLDEEGLRQNGISRDSALHLKEVAVSRAIPLDLTGIPGDRQTTSGSFVARFDKSSQPATTPGGLRSAPWWILATGSTRKSEALSLGPSMFPTSTSESQNVSGGLQGFYSTYIGPDRMWANETMIGLSGSAFHSDPYLKTPSAYVNVASSFADGSSSVRTLGLGAGSNSRRDDSWAAELVNNTTFFPANKTSKPIKLFLNGRFDQFNQQIGANRLGSFNYASIADFEANTPSSFTRALVVPDRAGGEFTGASAIAFNWTLKTVNLIGGVRADGNVFTTAPAYNPAVESAFGLRTDHVPNTLAFSPRLGFSWTYKGPPGFSASFGNVGQLYQAPINFRGGIGRFRSRVSPTSIGEALVSTGLAGSGLTISCFGPATPTPDWLYFGDGSATPFSSCAGSAPATFSDTAATVVAFSPDFRPQDTWRANFGSTRTFWKKTYISVDGFYSLNLGQPTTLDRNFSGTVRGSLPSEGNRPLFVGEGSIVPSSGVVSPVEARVSSQFGRVLERASDMRSTSRQIIVHTFPNVRWFDPFLGIDYVWTDTRVKRRGFDGSTAGDPRLAEWYRDQFASTHQINLQGGKSYKGLVLGGLLILQSGRSFTPLVGGDINGDGMSNDRAFIPQTAGADTASARLFTDLASLTANGSSRVRDCLNSQRGRIADPNSCRAPWTASMNALLATTPGFSKLPRRLSVRLNLANPLALLDMAVNGSDNLHGWGGQSFPDQTLLYVRGYDAQAHVFRYDVNQRFGSTSPRTTALLNPFRATLDVRIDLGRSAARQQVDIALRPPRNEKAPRASLDTILRRIYDGIGSTGPQDVYGHILYEKDSLALSSDQIAKLQAARVPYRAKVDSMMKDLANYLAALPGGYDGAEAARHISDTYKAAWTQLAAEGTVIQGIITASQLRLLWQPIVTSLTQPYRGGTWGGPAGARWIE